MSISSDLKNELEIKLLEAKITSIEKQNKRGLLREAMPSIFAIIFSIVAAGIVVSVGERVAKNALSELNKVEKKMSSAQNELLSLAEKRTRLQKINSKLRGEFSLYDMGVDLEIAIKSINHRDEIVVSTKDLDAELNLYDFCEGKFSFPGEVPQFSLCEKLRDIAILQTDGNHVLMVHLQ